MMIGEHVMAESAVKLALTAPTPGKASRLLTVAQLTRQSSRYMTEKEHTSRYLRKLYVGCLPEYVSNSARRFALKNQSVCSAATRLNCGVNAFALPVSKGEPAAGSEG